MTDSTTNRNEIVEKVAKLLILNGVLNNKSAAEVIETLQTLNLTVLTYFFKSDFKTAHTVLEMMHENISSNLLLLERKME